MKKIVGLLSIPTKYYLKISHQDAFSNSQYFPFSFFGGNVGGHSLSYFVTTKIIRSWIK